MNIVEEFLIIKYKRIKYMPFALEYSSREVFIFCIAW